MSDVEMSSKNNKTSSFNKLNNIMEHISTVAHVIIIAYIIFILNLCSKNELGLVTWHVILFAIGWMLLMCEAIMAITKNNVFTNNISHTLRVRIHWIMQTLAAACVIGGFTVIFTNKEKKNGKHFKSNHGLWGFIAFVCCFPTCLNGIAALFNVDLRRFIKPTLNKFIHAVSGIATFVIGSVAILLSVKTHWFQGQTTKQIQELWFGLLLFAIIWSIVQPLLTCFHRIKSFIK